MRWRRRARWSRPRPIRKSRRSLERRSASGIADRDDLQLALPGRQRDPAQVADRGPTNRAADRRGPGDSAVRGVRLVLPDERHRPLIVVLVGEGDGGAEVDPRPLRLRGWVHDLGVLHPPRQPSKPPVDLPKALAAVNIVAILGTVAIAGGPGDGFD